MLGNSYRQGQFEDSGLNPTHQQKCTVLRASNSPKKKRSYQPTKTDSASSLPVNAGKLQKLEILLPSISSLTWNTTAEPLLATN